MLTSDLRTLSRVLPLPERRSVGGPSPKRHKLFPVAKIRLLSDCQMPWAANCSNAILNLSHIASEVEGLGTSTRKELHVLCYQHHAEMPPARPPEPAQGMVYACREPGCFVGYLVS